MTAQNIVLAIVCFLLGFGAFAWGRMSKRDKIVGLLPEARVIKVEKGDTIILRYPGVFRPEQREALKRMFYERFKDQVAEVVILEAGLDADVMKKDSAAADEEFYLSRSAPPALHVSQSDNDLDEKVKRYKEETLRWMRGAEVYHARRRDDNRPHTQPEGDWEEEMPRSHVEPGKPWPRQ